MTKVYISHCAQDREAAAEVAKTAAANGLQTVSLGEGARQLSATGGDLEALVNSKLHDASAIVVLCSDEALVSRQVVTEINAAHALNKPLLAVQLSDCQWPPTLANSHRADLRTDRQQGLEQIRAWLSSHTDALGSSAVWPSTRSPYPGLKSFDVQDAAVFCGRANEIGDTLAALDQMLCTTTARMLVVVGPLGCGKASLLRAGLIPQLMAQPQRWLVLHPLKIDDKPFAGLAASISKTLLRYGEQIDEAVLTKGLRQAALTGPLDRRAQMGQQIAAKLSHKLRAVAATPQAIPLLPCIGLHRLLRRQDPAATGFVGQLGAMLKVAANPLVAIGTLDSTALPAWQNQHRTTAITSALWPLQALTEEQLRAAITEPAQTAGLTLEADFVQQLITAAVRVDDASLRQRNVAMVLNTLWRQRGRKGHVTADHLRPLLALFGPVSPRQVVTGQNSTAAPHRLQPSPGALVDSFRHAPQAPTARRPSAPFRPIPELDGPTPLDNPLIDAQGRLLSANGDEAQQQSTQPTVVDDEPAPPPELSQDALTLLLPPIPDVEHPPAETAEQSKGGPPDRPHETPAIAAPLEQTVIDDQVSATPTEPTEQGDVDGTPQSQEQPASTNTQLSAQEERARAARHNAAVPTRTTNRWRAVGVALLLLTVTVVASWHVGHRAHHGLSKAHRAVVSRHEPIPAAQAPNQRALTMGVATTAPSTSPQHDNATGIAAKVTQDALGSNAPHSGANASPPPQQLEQTRSEKEIVAPAQRAATAKDIVSKVLQAQAPLTGLLMLTSMSSTTHPKNGLRAALHVDAQQLPDNETMALNEAVKFISLSKQGGQIAAGNHQHVVVLDTTNGAVLGKWGSEGFVDARLSNDGRGVLSLHDDGKARWRLVGSTTTKVLGAVRPPQPGRRWSHVVFDNDTNTALVVARQSVARLWLDASRPPQEELSNQGKVRDLQQGSNSPLLITTAVNTLRLWKWRKGVLVSRLIDRIHYSKGDREFIDARLSVEGKMLVTADISSRPNMSSQRKIGLTVWHRNAKGYWWNVRAKTLQYEGGLAPRVTVSISGDGAHALANVMRPPQIMGEHSAHTTWFFSQLDWRRSRRGEHRVNLAAGGWGLLQRAIDEQATMVDSAGRERHLGGTAVTAHNYRVTDGLLCTGHTDGTVRTWHSASASTAKLGWRPVTAVKTNEGANQVATVQPGPDGSWRILDGASAGALLVNAPADGQLVTVHDRAKRAMCVNGRQLFVWRTDTQEPPMVAPLPPCGHLATMSFNANGDRVIAKCNGAQSALLVDWSKVIATLRTKVRRCLSAKERRLLLTEPAPIATARAHKCQSGRAHAP